MSVLFLTMDDFKSGARSVLARSVSAEVRARMGARRMSQREFAAAVGFQSHNYVAIRNRDESPYTLDDIARICGYFDEEPYDFIRRALASHGDDVFSESMAALKAGEDLTTTEVLGSIPEALLNETGRKSRPSSERPARGRRTS